MPHHLPVPEFTANRCVRFHRALSAALLTLAAVTCGTQLVHAAQPPTAALHADFAREQPSAEARQIADWALDSHDNAGMPYVVVDKVGARVFVFDAQGRLLGASPALLGLARGDASVPGIGSRKLSTVPKERRLQRLASSMPLEHRITFGCINVPVAFYETVVSPAFKATSGIVYVLPETRPAREVFGSYDVAARPASDGRQDGSTAGSSR
jgi:hypothetical protein